MRYNPTALRYLRVERALSIDELSVRARLSPRQLRNIEDGAIPKADTLGRLAAALDAPLVSFYVSKGRAA